MTSAAAIIETTEGPREQWRARALELAERRHLTGTARYAGEDDRHWGRLWRVRSQRHADVDYLVFVGDTGRLDCPCPAGTWGRPCAHAGAALHAEAQRTRALQAPERDVFSTWRKGGEW